jgi:opacity protein-like surface antigen
MRNRLLTTANSSAVTGSRSLAAVLGWAMAAATMLAFGAAAHAQETERTNIFEITPFVGFMAGGGFEDPATGAERDVEDDASFGIFLNLMADTPERQYELLYVKQSSAVEGVAPMDLDVQYLHIGGTVAYPQSQYVMPYVGATIGATWLKPDMPGLDDETKLSFSFGGGVRFPITDHLGIRFDVRAFLTLIDDDSEIFCVSNPPSAGCSIRPKSDTFIQYTGSLGVSFSF